MSQVHESQFVHNVALVLGGGGAAGNAWEIGVIAGLAEAGLDLTEVADLVIGTSAGATTAVQVRSGVPTAELLSSVLSPPVRPAGGDRELPPSLPVSTVFERMRAIGTAATSAADLQRAMGTFGLESDSMLGPGAAQRRAMVAARLPRHDWPDRQMIVTAIDAHTGELAAFDRDSGIDLVDAVTASTALPGLVPTVSVNGALHRRRRALRRERRPCLGLRERRGARAVGRTDGDATGRPVRGPTQIAGVGHGPGKPGRGLHEKGSQVEMITPDADSRAAMGTNLMDLTTRPFRGPLGAA